MPSRVTRGSRITTGVRALFLCICVTRARHDVLRWRHRVIVHWMAFCVGNFALVRGDEDPSHTACSQAASAGKVAPAWVTKEG